MLAISLFTTSELQTRQRKKITARNLQKIVITFLALVHHLEFGCREYCYEMRSTVLIDDVSWCRTIAFVSSRTEKQTSKHLTPHVPKHWHRGISLTLSFICSFGESFCLAQSHFWAFAASSLIFPVQYDCLPNKQQHAVLIQRLQFSDRTCRWPFASVLWQPCYPSIFESFKSSPGCAPNWSFHFPVIGWPNHPDCTSCCGD